MKLRFLSFLLLTVIIGAINQSCSSSDDNDIQFDDDTQAQAEAIVVSGNWRISSYVDSGNDETTDYNGYLFTFRSNGTVIAENGNRIQAGTWSVTSSDSQDDETEGDLDFNLFFDVPEDDIFDDLIDDWDIVSINANMISLIDVSGGS
ncbi:MAG: hypothetical protein R3213_03870, partial [Flavobacteriaceae bacterium]|nr:hypothetical protein [Flavobacteriaceae bacterium]